MWLLAIEGDSLVLQLVFLFLSFTWDGGFALSIRLNSYPALLKTDTTSSPDQPSFFAFHFCKTNNGRPKTKKKLVDLFVVLRGMRKKSLKAARLDQLLLCLHVWLKKKFEWSFLFSSWITAAHVYGHENLTSLERKRKKLRVAVSHFHDGRKQSMSSSFFCLYLSSFTILRDSKGNRLRTEGVRHHLQTPANSNSFKGITSCVFRFLVVCSYRRICNSPASYSKQGHQSYSHPVYRNMEMICRLWNCL